MAYSAANHRRRTILMTECRAKQIAIASAELGVSGEVFIQSAITAALLTAAEHNDTLALAFSRAAGAGWDELQAIAKVRAERNAKAALVRLGRKN
jgi:hypothetical protein